MVFPKVTHARVCSPKGFSQDLRVEPLEIETQLLHNIPCHNVKPWSAPRSTDSRCSLSEGDEGCEEGK